MTLQVQGPSSEGKDQKNHKSEHLFKEGDTKTPLKVIIHLCRNQAQHLGHLTARLCSLRTALQAKDISSHIQLF